MSERIDITSSAKRVDGGKAAEREKRLDDIAAKKEADRAAAAEIGKAREREAEAAATAAKEARRAEEAAAAKAEEEAAARREAVQQIGSAALSVGSAVAGTAAQDLKSGKLKLTSKTMLVAAAVIIGIALLLLLAWPRLSALVFPANEPQTHTAAELSESAVMGNVSAEIGQAILGEARQKQDLVVWEQDVQVESNISRALANIPLFAKTKTVRSFGTGVYTVDMGHIDNAAISVDEATRTVTIRIPRAQLHYITKDLEKTEFEDTQHAIFGFGDVKLTQEQQNVLEQSIEDAMRDELESEDCLADANEAALLVVYDVYQPLVVQVDSAFTLDVQFAD